MLDIDIGIEFDTIPIKKQLSDPFDITIYRKFDVLIYRNFRYDIQHSPMICDGAAVMRKPSIVK